MIGFPYFDFPGFCHSQFGFVSKFGIRASERAHDKVPRCRINAAFLGEWSAAFMRQGWGLRRNLSFALSDYCYNIHLATIQKRS